MIEHKEARELFQYAIDRDRINRLEAEQDLRFRAGEQWPEEVRAQRRNEERPCLVINRCGQFVRRVTGAARQNPPSIKVAPTDGMAGDEQQQRDQAEVREGLIRHIEHRSRGRWQYINALENAATCGVGHIRILTEYDERDPFQQEIRFASVRDPLSVVYDPDAQRLTREDGLFAFVTGLLSPKAFKRSYPKASVSDWDQPETSMDSSRYWESGDTVRVVEMFRRVPEMRKLVLFSDGNRVARQKGDDDVFAQAVAKASEMGITPVAEREVEFHKVFRSVISGADYLEDEVEFPSRFIPLIPMVGEEMQIGEANVRHGMIRFMRDPQRLYNYWRSAAAEMVALAPKAPFLATAKQIGPFKAMWDTAHKSPRPYLLYSPDPEAATPVPARATAPEPPSAMWQEASVASEDMKGVSGIYDAALGAQSNETSGRAIIARQREGDVGTFIYIDNMRHAVERLGVTLLDMIPRVYDAERIVQVMEENGDVKPYEINQTMPDGTIRNDLSTGAYEVRVSTGPTFQSKQEETAQMTLELMKALPAVATMAADILVRNMDFPGSDEIAQRLEAAMNQQPQPNPKDIAEAEKDKADAMQTTAEATKTVAETESIALDNLAKKLAYGLS